MIGFDSCFWSETKRGFGMGAGRRAVIFFRVSFGRGDVFFVFKTRCDWDIRFLGEGAAVFLRVNAIFI